ncbi:protein of unknown function [Shewanella benthica]|uniref:Uncharacterized protein n=1 Tax=Shewanella benthica TaxID=43661 RepID=A0A330LY25_9GAMM|nr:protein of unknown function [Shewanella benthica]
MWEVSRLHDYMDIGGRAKQDARAEDAIIDLAHERT